MYFPIDFIKSVQIGVVDFSYFILLQVSIKVDWFIKKVMNIIHVWVILQYSLYSIQLSEDIKYNKKIKINKGSNLRMNKLIK